MVPGVKVCIAPEALPEKHWIGRSFSRAASGYDRVAALQRQVAEQLLARVRAIPTPPGTILDVGAGTGYCTDRLAHAFPDAGLIALDIAEGMLRTLNERLCLQGKSLLVCGDAEWLPLRDNAVDLVFSNLALQWCSDLPAVLTGFKKVLRPGGALLFSTFGEATLCELRNAWAQVDGYSHVNAFYSKESVEAALAGVNFIDVEVNRESRVLSYPAVEAVLRELKSLGAHNVTANRPRHLTGKGAFRKMLESYGASIAEGRIEASFEVLYGHARMADEGYSGGN